MATVLQWQSHITDSTDSETILGNIDFLEHFAGAIMGDESLKANFNAIRTKIKDGTLKPTEWKSSEELKIITTKLTNASSGKVKSIDGRLKVAEESVEDHEAALKKKLESSDFNKFKAGDFKTATDRLTTAEGSIESHGTRLTDAETNIGKKLDSKTFENFKTGDFKTIPDWKSSMEEKVGSFASSAELESLKTLLNNEVSHWTSDTTPAPQSYTATAKVKASKQPWGTNEDPERHVGDLCTVIGEGQEDKGVSYRFIKNPSADSYKWLKVIDNDGILALNAHNQFLTTYKTRQDKLDADAKETQKTIDAINKKLGGTKIDLDKLNQKAAEQQQHIEEMQAQYKVTVTTRGSIRNGEIVDGVPRNGYPAILHTAHVYDTAGKEISDIDTLNKLEWTVNKGRTTAPLQFVVPGATCYITEKDLVRTVVESGTAPCYYDIELNSNF